MQQPSQARDPFLDALGSGIGEVQAHGVLTAAVSIKSGTGHKGYFLRDGLAQELLAVDALRQGGPDEQAAIGFAPLRRLRKEAC